MYKDLKYCYLRDHKLFRALSHSQIKQLCIIKNSYSNLISKDAQTRMYQFLKDRAEKEGIRKGNMVAIENYLAQTDIGKLFVVHGKLPLSY